MRRYDVRVIGPELNKEDKVRAESIGGATAKAFMRYPEARTAIVTFRGHKFESTNPKFEAKKIKVLDDKLEAGHEHVIPEGGMPEPSCPACEAGLPKRPAAINTKGSETGRIQTAEPNIPAVPRSDEHHDEELIPGTGGV